MQRYPSSKKNSIPDDLLYCHASLNPFSFFFLENFYVQIFISFYFFFIRGKIRRNLFFFFFGGWTDGWTGIEEEEEEGGHIVLNGAAEFSYSLLQSASVPMEEKCEREEEEGLIDNA